jgi:hypothetical protein
MRVPVVLGMDKPDFMKLFLFRDQAVFYRAPDMVPEYLDACKDFGVVCVPDLSLVQAVEV